ncbi:MAG: beta-galactosidase, partial [Clostridia bacterium]|nr:beta-galactosidase [Clostridia bacterium]
MQAPARDLAFRRGRLQLKRFVNGSLVGTHKGGYSPFSFDITDFLTESDNYLSVYAEDDTRSTDIPSGKQSHELNSFGCFYTRTTGIWQTVWLEFVPEHRINDFRIITDVSSQSVTLTASLTGVGILKASVFYDGRLVGFGETEGATLTLKLDELHLWEIGQGRLYDLCLSFGEDRVKSYFGMRDIRFDGHKFLLNGKSVFQRLVLDQGFYPDGIYTASSDSELENDVLRSMAMGFNGARLHEKVFEERFLYHCDRLGYIVWGEYPSWGLDISRPESIACFLPEWISVVMRDINHPS